MAQHIIEAADRDTLESDSLEDIVEKEIKNDVFTI